MKKYLIEIALKYNKEPNDKEFETHCNLLVDKLDELYKDEDKCYTFTKPTQRDLELRRYFYRIEVTMSTDKKLSSRSIYDALNEVYPLFLVHLKETRFCKQDSPVYWLHEGETTYHDGSTYISPNYDFYINGDTYYTVQYVPIAIKNLNERDKKKYNGVSYMWRCTGSWDNFMEAKTIDEAIEEFEKYYQKQLWRAVEGCRKDLEEATDNFAQFEDYRWRKKW